ncbi:MAG: MFS transporter [Acidimicrobiales bacterium]
MRAPWRTGDVWAISASAFFADLGYQAVLAGFPLFLVLTLHQPVWEYGLASALSYGGGAAFSYIGGRAGDRVGHRRLALAGNAVIPLLSLSAVVASPALAIGLLTGGWWARNLRSPSRRVMLLDAVPAEENRSAAFGFLHALDVGGGALAGVYLVVALAVHVPFRWIFLGTALPLAISTLVLSRARTGARSWAGPPTPAGLPPAAGAPDAAEAPGAAEAPAPDAAEPPPGARALLAAAGLYGFTYYSVGFPVLTVAQASDRLVAGIGAFLLLQATSAATGYVLGGRLGRGPAGQFARLGLLGYLGAAAGAAVIAVGYAEGRDVTVLLVGVAVVGFALGIVETLEPSAMSMLRPGARAGRGFGALSAARSAGAFVGNLVMGLLYGAGASLAYGYAALVAAAAGVVVLGALPALRSWQRGAPGGAGGGPGGR